MFFSALVRVVFKDAYSAKKNLPIWQVFGCFEFANLSSCLPSFFMNIPQALRLASLWKFVLAISFWQAFSKTSFQKPANCGNFSQCRSKRSSGCILCGRYRKSRGVCTAQGCDHFFCSLCNGSKGAMYVKTNEHHTSEGSLVTRYFRKHLIRFLFGIGNLPSSP